MSKLGRLWDWLLPRLICIDPIGAIAYYNSGFETETDHPEAAGARRRAHVPDASGGPVIVHLARL